ncbi:hypothetical protein JYU34_010976 [Plutella xylostella]|uniref:Uncharacterized protein n=1 Tax=Plutella xylostella TaxID=51655 RepID=A0ABQ7QH17_PLUXY|nr:hypothetical protein JYU34_010976 [Plutella xylostella]
MSVTQTSALGAERVVAACGSAGGAGDTAAAACTQPRRRRRQAVTHTRAVPPCHGKPRRQPWQYDSHQPHFMWSEPRNV